MLELRVKNIDFERREITIRRGKGGKDRLTMLPAVLARPLRDHLRAVKTCTRPSGSVAPLLLRCAADYVNSHVGTPSGLLARADLQG